MAAYISGMLKIICALITRWPRPSVEPMNISATMTMTSANEMPERMPMKVCGSDSSSVTPSITRALDAPMTMAAAWRTLRAFITP